MRRITPLIRVFTLCMLTIILSVGRSAKAQLCLEFQEQEQTRQGEASLSDDLKSLIHTAGAIAFAQAWPTARYTGLCYGDVRLVSNGADVRVKLTGTGVNARGGSDLWVMLVISIRNRQIVDTHFAENNGYFPPQFFYQAVSLFAQALIKSFSSAPSQGEPSFPPYTVHVQAPPVFLPYPSRHALPLSASPVLTPSKDEVGPGALSGNDLLRALDNSVWIADGPPSTKQLYVIASPCDPYSRQFYALSRKFVSSVQLRWIEEVPSNEKECRFFMGEVASSDSNLLIKAYESGIPPATVSKTLEDNAVRWNDGVENAARPLLRYITDFHGNPFYFPMVVWVSPRGIEASMRPEDIDKIFSSIVERPEATNAIPASRALLPMEFTTEPADRKKAWAKFDGVKLYSLPDEHSQITSTMPKDSGYPIASKMKLNGETWLEMQCAPEPYVPNLYVRDKDVAKEK